MHGLTEREQMAQVEAALRTYPLAEMPPDLAGRVMRRVRAVPAARFRISWLDWLVSLAVPAAGILLMVAWASLPPQAVAYLQVRALLGWQFLQRVGLEWLPLAAALVVVGFFVEMTIRLVRPPHRRPRLIRTIS
jgi:hypothetical protein